MPSSILLLDPYRSALLTMGLMEGILASPRGVDFKQSSTYLLGKNADRQSTVLRLAMLFDEVSIVSHEQRGVAEEYNAQGLPTLSTMPLQDMGLIRLTNRDITHPWEGAVLAGRSLGGIWQAIKGDLEPWEPLIVPYLLDSCDLPCWDPHATLEPGSISGQGQGGV